MKRRQECSFKDWENLPAELSSSIAVNDHQVNSRTDNRMATESDKVDSVPKCKSGGRLATSVGILLSSPGHSC